MGKFYVFRPDGLKGILCLWSFIVFCLCNHSFVNNTSSTVLASLTFALNCGWVLHLHCVKTPTFLKIYLAGLGLTILFIFNILLSFFKPTHDTLTHIRSNTYQLTHTRGPKLSLSLIFKFTFKNVGRGFEP